MVILIVLVPLAKTVLAERFLVQIKRSFRVLISVAFKSKFSLAVRLIAIRDWNFSYGNNHTGFLLLEHSAIWSSQAKREYSQLRSDFYGY